MKPRSARVVELLNAALTFELTVINSYFLTARVLDNWGLPKLGKVFYDLSIGEMKDADELVKRILFFEGHPNLQKLNPLAVGEDPKEMLEISRDSEYAASQQFNDAASECRELGDHATAELFERMALDEEEHADWFEAQLDAINLVGLENYLAQQVDAGQAPA
ncbi:MAG: bacterioferritin [Propionibacteriaceae bacterium]|nr:bacterioferritin [Propionibacteriaceae bacterium]